MRHLTPVMSTSLARLQFLVLVIVVASHKYGMMVQFKEMIGISLSAGERKILEIRPSQFSF